jgi:hypothetical protein
MSTEGARQPETPAIAPHIEAVRRETAALTAALARGRRIRLVLMMVLVVFILIVCGVFYRLGTDFTDERNLDRMVQVAQNRLERNSDRYMKEVQLLIDHSSPPLTEAFGAQVKKDLPRFFQTMEQERDVLAKSLHDQLSKKLEAHYQQLISQQDRILKAEFPLIEDPKTHERMSANIDLALQKLVKKYYIEQLDAQTKSLFEAWDQFPAAELSKAGQPSVEDRFLAALIEMLKFKLSRTDRLSLR